MPAAAYARRVHGDGGVYYKGSWVPLKDLGAAWCPPDTVWSGSTRQAPRPAVSTGFDADVVIVGAGCVGAAVARALSKLAVGVVLVEASDDVTQGATKGNSGIVHAGFDDAPGSVRAAHCARGNAAFTALDAELRFGLQRNGSLVVARGAEDEATLRALLARGAENGVPGLRIVGEAELRAIEPGVARDATAALLAPTAATLTPYEYTIALAENAVDNGVALRTRTRVVALAPLAGGGFDVGLEEELPPSGGGGSGGGSSVGAAAAVAAAAAAAVVALRDAAPGAAMAAAAVLLVALCALLLLMRGHGGGGGGGGGARRASSLRARYVVNAAGCASDAVARLVGDDSFYIKPRLGEYLLLRKEAGAAARHILFPAPGKMGKGVLVQTTLWGNLILGPTAADVADPATAARSAADIVAAILTKCRELVPSFDAAQVIHSFAGARAKSSTGDWVLRASAVAPDLIHAAGIDSPGLAGSPSVADEVVRLLVAAGLPTPPNAAFNPHRKPIIVPKVHGAKPLAAVVAGAPPVPITVDGDTPATNVVCRCERVTEAELVDALRRSLPAASTQAMRKRTRAGMGYCQGEFCEPRVAALIARETGTPPALVPRRPWPASSILPKRWLDEQDIEELLKCPGGGCAAGKAE